MEKYGKFIKLLGYDDLIPKADKTEHNHFTFIRMNNNINKLNTYNYDIDEVIRINDLRNPIIFLDSNKSISQFSPSTLPRIQRTIIHNL